MFDRYFEILQLKNLVGCQELLLLRCWWAHRPANGMFYTAHHRLGCWVAPQHWDLRPLFNAFWSDLLQALVLQGLPAIVMRTKTIRHLSRRNNCASRGLEHVLWVASMLKVLECLKLSACHIWVNRWHTPGTWDHASTIFRQSRCRIVRPKDWEACVAVPRLQLAQSTLWDLSVLLLDTKLKEVLQSVLNQQLLKPFHSMLFSPILLFTVETLNLFEL